MTGERPWERGDHHERWLGYLNPATGLLLINAAVQPATAIELERFENARVEDRAVDLRLEPIEGAFDLAHVKAIHYALFQDVYPWAGEVRTVNITKGERVLPDGSIGPAPFLDYRHIPYVVDGMAANLRAENYLRGLTSEQFADRLAVHFNDLNEAHPFREGNGRTQRMFWDHLAAKAGHVIQWHAMTAEVNVAVSHQARQGNLEPLRNVLRTIVQPRTQQSLEVKALEASRIAGMDTPRPPQAKPPANSRMSDQPATPGYRPHRGMEAGYGR